MKTTPLWFDSAEMPNYPALDRSITVDVLIVGGGIAGITTGYLLRRAGLSVAVLERDRIARVDTGHTTAHLTHVTDERLHALVKHFGEDHARAVWDAGSAAIEQIEQNAAEEKIDCEFTRVPGYLHAPVDGKDDTQTLREDARLASHFGFDASYVDQVPHMGTPGVRFSDQAKFHPLKYVAGLAGKIASADGSSIYEQSDAKKFDSKKRRAQVNGHSVNYGVVVLASHNPLSGESDAIHSMLFQTKLALYTSYVLGGRIPRGAIPIASYWDTDEPYTYLRVERGDEFDYAIFGGEDHKTGQVVETERCYGRLEKKLRRIAPDVVIDHRWSGQVIETNDGLPFIGESDPGQFISSGFSGNGMTFGTVAGMMAADWVMQRKNPWQELFEPSRKKLRGGTWDYLKENADYPYYLLKGRLLGAEGSSLKELKPGEGKVLKLDGKKMAVYRDADGKVTKRSAICTHLGCIVRWNKSETTWDCPCHGSRFQPDGTVISGPAESSLGS